MRFLTFLLFCLVSCSPGPEPFQYGLDKCTVCNKSIHNTRSGGELITVKGQVLKFDSIECLLKYYKAHEFSGEEYTWITVIDYDEPGVLIPVNDAVFLKRALNRDSFANDLIAVSKMEYSGHYLKNAQWTQGIYWSEALWRYH